MGKAGTLDEKMLRLRLHGVQNLVSALGEVMGVAVDGDDQGVH